MQKIDPSAKVSEEAILEDDVIIGPWVIIEDEVTIGAGTRIDAHCVIKKGTVIGQQNEIHPGAIIGEDPQDLVFDKNTVSYVRIGDNNIIREYATIHRGTESGSTTIIGNHNFLMAQSHVAHNCVIGDHVVVCNCALISGHVEVEDHGFISGGVVIQQFARIGKHAIVGGNTRVNNNIPPFIRAVGYNAEVYGLNVVGLKRYGMSKETISKLNHAYKILFRSKLRLEERLKKIEDEVDCDESRHLVDFIR
ncbi:MAG: acyl-ACP--UDP-N-acetylglucosamine O-acyltransferase, partial [Candidatus Heimdallarchaeota archaeon]